MKPLDFNPAGMLVSEKLDGCAATWTGTRLLSRNGHLFRAPEWFTATLPTVRLCGELWMGRGTFNALVSSIQRKTGDWLNVTFRLYDGHFLGGFETRVSEIARLELPEHCRLIEQRRIATPAEVDLWEAQVVANGGEGLVARRPDSPFRPGAGFHKIKRIHKDLNRKID